MTTEEIAVYVLDNYGPFGLLIFYMWINQRRQRSAIICLAESVDGVSADKVRRSTRVLADD